MADPKERAWIEQKLLADRALSIGGEQSSIRGVLKSINLWKLVGIYFFVQVGFYGFALWMPNLIKHLTGSGMTIVGVPLRRLTFCALSVSITSPNGVIRR